MGKDKKKKKKKKKNIEGEIDTFSQLLAKKGKGSVTLGEIIDRSGDKLFLGTDYREVLIPERPWADMLADVEHWTRLPFTHGIEMELILADDNGNYPPGEEMVFRMKEIVKDAIKIMDEILYEGRTGFLPVPDYIREKVLTRPWGRDDLEKGYAMQIRYQLGDTSVDIDTFARDGNVTAITYIL
ncbi:hypothetical protein LCGC14_3027150 [marine sediment metagenome]|uniref:Uncharacterized protein n=1 Tax=marine sediment metagenome TaxID=412755 RepID=A0A0F8XGN3_9ZZZZ